MPLTRRQIYRRRRTVVFGGAAVALATSFYLPITLLAPLHDAVPVELSVATPAVEQPTLDFPSYGASGLGAIGYPGVLAQGGVTDPLPIASISKVVTALVVLDAKPLAPGESGPDLTFSSVDEDFYNEQVAQNGVFASVSAGRVMSQRTIDVDVPAGVDDGTRLRLAGRGAAAPRGGPPGDLYVTIRVAATNDFERHGDDLLAVRRIGIAQAALGTELEIDGLDGAHTVSVPPGTQPGQLFRIKGAGVPSLRGRGRGDLLVRVDVEVPTKLDDEEAELLHRLAEHRGETVAPPSKGVFARLRSAFQ